MGYKDFELPPGQKAPPPKGWQQLAGNMEIRPGFNIGRSTENFTVVDCDTKELGDRYWAKYPDRVTTVVETPRGFHFYHSGTTNGQQRNGWDVRGIGNYVVGPDSVVNDIRYRLVTVLLPIEYLRPFPPELLRKTETPERLPELESFRRINRAKAYASTVLCIKGRQAHNTFFRLVCFMRDIGLSPAETYAIILDWNFKNCFHEDGTTPYPWSTREVEHKIADAYSKVSK
jgi:hypothetical protein